MTAYLRGLPRAAVIALGLVAPSGVVAQTGMCGIPDLLGALSDVEHVRDVTGAAVDTSDPALLMDVIEAARLQVNRNSGSSKALDQMATRISEPGAKAAPTLSQAERRFFLRWLALCGTPRNLPDARPDYPAAGLARLVDGNGPGTAPARGVVTAARNDGAAEAGERQHRSGRLADGGSSRSEALSFAEFTGTMLAAVALGVILMVAAQAVFARDERRSRRYQCRARSSIGTSDGSFPAMIVDVSQKGCKVRFRNAPPLQDDCRIWIGGRWRRCRVIWSNKHYAGIRLTEILERSLVQALARGEDPMSVTGAAMPQGPGGPQPAGGLARA